MARTSKTTGDMGTNEAEVAVTPQDSDNDDLATLRITVDVHDGPHSHCRPCAEDIHVCAGAAKVTVTEHHGVFKAEIDTDTALVDVVADPFTCEKSCRTFTPVYDRTSVQVTRGCATHLTVKYVPGQSSIEITPRLPEIVDAHGHCVERFVPGVRFRLFTGSGDGAPVTKVTSAANPTVSFVDLQPGPVTLLTDVPARLGAEPIELRHARSTSLRIDLGAGQNVNLDDKFEFAPAAGDVTVRVVDDRDDRDGIADIPVRLSRIDNGADGNPQPALTDGTGLATFTTVPAGTYRVELTVDPIMVAGRTWTTPDAAPAVVIDADDVRGSVVLRLVEDRHIVAGTVYGPDGSPAGHTLVEIRTAPDDRNPHDTVLTNSAGQYEWEAPYAGEFFLTTARQDGNLLKVYQVSVNSVARLDIFTDGGSGSSGGPSGGGGGGSTTTVDQDPTPFPLLVGNVDLTSGTAPQGTAGGGGGYGSGAGASMQSAGATVSAAIRDVLGYRTKTTDTKGFLTALQRSFSCYDKAGYTVCTWTPRSYAATIPADLGALTGAQASIFERAKWAADAIIPLLDGLTPLASDADQQDVDAIRSIVRSRITEIVAELSLEGGPRTQRVDELFERLTGKLPGPVDHIVLVDFGSVAGELRVLGERFGLSREEINTIAEEEDFTNFLIIVDSVASLFVTWQQVRGFFDRAIVDDDFGADANAPFLGTQLVLISRQLGVVTETVRETYFAMDSVFLGPAERQTVLLTLFDEGNRPTTILLSELLDWIDRFVTDEGPHLIQEAGTDGVNAFVPTITRLATLAESAAVLKQVDNPQIPPTFFTGRVILALQQLAGQVRQAERLAKAVFERLFLPDVGSDAGGYSGNGGKSVSGNTFRTNRRGGRR